MKSNLASNFDIPDNKNEIILWGKSNGHNVPREFTNIQRVGIALACLILFSIGKIFLVPILIFFFFRRKKYNEEFKSLERIWIAQGKPKIDNLVKSESKNDNFKTKIDLNFKKQIKDLNQNFNDLKEQFEINNIEESKDNENQIETKNKDFEVSKKLLDESQKKLDEQKKLSFGFGIPQFELIFVPSEAKIPKGFLSTGDELKDLKIALKKPSTSMRSFFNDFKVLQDGFWNEDTLFCPPFDENLFCKVLKENHRKGLADKNYERLKAKGAKDDKYTMFGAVAGIMTGGLAPLMVSNILSRTGNTTKMADQPLEDFFSDPSIVFSEDEGSFISLSTKYRTQTLKRRIMLKKRELKDKKVYFDLIPMILFENCATPGQVFKFLDGYTFRPIAAGSPSIIKSDLGYNPIKIRRSLTYNPKTDLGKIAKVMNTKIIGETIEKDCIIYYGWGKDDPSLNHFYFDYPVDKLF